MRTVLSGTGVYIPAALVVVLLIAGVVWVLAARRSRSRSVATQELHSDLARVRRECADRLTKQEIISQVTWRDEKSPEVFTLSKGYVALIPCSTGGALVPIDGEPASYEADGYTVALRFPGTDSRWEGVGMFYFDHLGKNKIREDLSGKLGPLFQPTE